MTPAMKNTTAVVATAIPTAAPAVNESAVPVGKEKLGHQCVKLLMLLIILTMLT